MLEKSCQTVDLPMYREYIKFLGFHGQKHLVAAFAFLLIGWRVDSTLRMVLI